MVEDGLDMYFLERDLELYTAVLLTTSRRLVVCDRHVRTVTHSAQTLCRYPLVDQVLHHSVRTLVRQFLVQLCLTGVIGVTLYFDDIGIWSSSG